MSFRREKTIDYNCALYAMDNEGAPRKRDLKIATLKGALGFKNQDNTMILWYFKS